MDNKIGLIAPYAELANAAVKTRTDLMLDFPIEVGLMEEAIGPAKSLIQQGAKVIISRGGTATLLRNTLDVPVVEIPVTGYDFVRALRNYIGKDYRIGIVGYQNVVQRCRIIGELLGLSINEFIIPSGEIKKDWDSVRQHFTQFIDSNNIQVVIGDTLVKWKLKFDNINMQLIESGDEAITQAIEEALHIAQVRNNERRASERLRTIIHSVHDGVVATDENGMIIAVNHTAEEIFGFLEADVIGANISKSIPNTQIDRVLMSGQPEIEQLQLMSKGYIVTNQVPIIIEGKVHGVVATYQEAAKIERVEHKIRKTFASRGLSARYHFGDILTEDPYLRRLIDIAQKYAQTDATMLILGESGTGKELFAQSIHNHSPRQNEAFVAVNCSALPGPLLESELFGYEEGAFTGAKKGGKRGLFELAHSGTIFLDEIGEMNKELQARLLRVLEEKQVMRLGSDSIIPVNVRVIAATNIDLWTEAKNHRFRLDLYYRLNVLSINLPPLRERPKDISMLTDWFFRRYCKQYDKKINALPLAVIEKLHKHQWFGNVRELKNIVERIVLSTEGDTIDLETVDLMLGKYSTSEGSQQTCGTSDLLTGTLSEIKRKAAMDALLQEGNNIALAAKRLQIDRNTLKKLL